MATLAALASTFATAERPAGNVLDAQAVLAQALAAVRFYAGYAELSARFTVDALQRRQPILPVPALSGTTDISESEWALIRPLFLLYIERETALQLEASRGMGVDVFGRSSSEVAGDIAQSEAEMPHRAFCRAILTV